MNEQPQPTGETTIVIVPPHDICAFADHYRHLYMPDRMHRIEPHITVVYPFVPLNELEGVLPRLQAVLEACPPRAVSLRGFAIFRESGVLYLYLAHDERVLSLHKAILAEFPDYPAYGGQYGEDFTPHVTVGCFTDPQELEKVYAELEGLHLFLAWDVESVQLKYKTTDGIWHTCAELPLGRVGSNC